MNFARWLRIARETSLKQSQSNGVSLVIRDIFKSYGHERVLNNISLTVEAGSMLTLLGPSGCGKSTLLRIIAGFVNADSGEVLLDDQNIVGLPPNRRETAMVFQNYTLFPHMRVIENVMFGLKMRRMSRGEALERATQALELVQLPHLANRYPSQLSGGQMQRVALARALVTQPKILLLDEPFAALDKNLREDMQVELRKLQQSLGLTMVCVTHDQREAMVISDYVAVMNHGQIVQFGTPLDVYDHPRFMFTAQFIGGSNILQAQVLDAGVGRHKIRLNGGLAFNIDSGLELQSGQQVKLAVKPRTLSVRGQEVLAKSDGADGMVLPGTVTNTVLLGASISYEILSDGGARIIAEEDRAPNSGIYSVGEKVVVMTPSSACVVLEDSHET